MASAAYKNVIMSAVWADLIANIVHKQTDEEEIKANCKRIIRASDAIFHRWGRQFNDKDIKHFQKLIFKMKDDVFTGTKHAHMYLSFLLSLINDVIIHMNDQSKIAIFQELNDSICEFILKFDETLTDHEQYEEAEKAKQYWRELV